MGNAIVPQQRYNRQAQGPWFRESAAGVVIDEENVLEIDVILACVRVLAESVASLPLELLETDDKGNINPALEHPVYDLLRWQPNPECTAYELRFEMMCDSILRGYGACQVLRTVKGRPMELWPLMAQFLYCRRAPDDNRLIYLYKFYGPDREIKEIMLEANEVLIIKSFSRGGLLGTSMTRKMFNVLGAHRAVENFTAEYFQNGSVHSGIIEVPEEMSEEAYRRLRKDWIETHTGTGNRHKAPILEGGAKFNALTLNAEETQLLETQKYKRSTLAGVLRVPAHLINDLEKATFSNIEQLDLDFAKHSLRPWLTNWEQRLQLIMLNSGERKRFKFVHDLLDLLRGDMPSRYTAYGLAVNAGILSPNDCRRRENLNPYKGGDVYLVQGALRDINTPPPAAAPAAAPGKPGKPKPKATKQEIIDCVKSFITDPEFLSQIVDI